MATEYGHCERCLMQRNAGIVGDRMGQGDSVRRLRFVLMRVITINCVGMVYSARNL